MKSHPYLSATLSVWLLVSILLLRRYRGIFDLEPEDQKLMYYSESAFYLSFYYDVVDAPSWAAVWNALTHDDRTEYPEIVVAFKRLNIVQEIILGSFYRLCNLRYIFSNPFNFYAFAVLVLNAGGVALLFLLACKIGKSRWAGVLFFGLYLSNFYEKLISRISALPLRENFALPALWASLLCIRHILAHRRRVSRHYTFLFVAYTWMILTWQLSLHILATQLGCLFLLNLFNAVTDAEMKRISVVALGSLTVSWLLMLCPSFLLTSVMFTGCLAVFISMHAIQSDGISSQRFRVYTAFQKVMLSLTIFVFANALIALTSRHDGHINEILLSKLGLSRPTFDSQIYLMGAEFRTISASVLQRIASTRLFHYAAASLMILMLLSCKGDRSIRGFQGRFNYYLGIQLVVFASMATMVSRLRVLALPLMCVFSGYSMLLLRLPRVKTSNWITMLMISLALAPYFTTMPVHEMRTPPVGELYNRDDLKDLVQWVNHHLEPGTPILSDMPTSSALRAASSARIVLNPQYEYTPLRRKTHFFYTLGDCNDARWFGETLRGRYKTDVVIVPMKFCTIPRDKGPYGVQKLLSLNPLGTCPSGAPYYRRLCNRLWAGNSHFELLFSNSRYLAFRYKGPSEVAEERPWEVMHRLDHYKPWIEKHAVLDNVLGPRQIVSTARALSTHFNSPVVLPLLRYGLEMFPGNEDMLRMYAETADYDLAMFDEAKKYYEIVFESMGSRCHNPEDLTFYAMYLSHMVETGTGEDSEIMGVIEASKKCLGLTFPRLYAHQLCEHAVVVLKAFKNKLGAPQPSVQRAAVSFFNLSKDVNHQNECFLRNYSIFNAVDLTAVDLLIMFLTGR